jgi:uncharacterized protein YdaU (DUF1376 family)
LGNDYPWFPLYTSDWILSTVGMTDEQAGAYMLLLCHAWNEEGLPADEQQVRNIGRWSPAAWRRIWSVVGAKWELRDGRLVNPRQEEERERAHSGSRMAATSSHERWKSNREGHQTRSRRLSAAREKGTHTDVEWGLMLSRYKRCLRCGATGVKLVKDHIVPIYQGGSDSISNLQPLCLRCNKSKGPDATDHRVGLPETYSEWLPNVSGDDYVGDAERLRNVSDPQLHTQYLPPTPSAERKGRPTRAERKAVLRAVGPAPQTWRDRCAAYGHDPECGTPEACVLLAAKSEQTAGATA